MKGIADTGLIVALLNRDDRYHQWALEIARAVSEPLLTCESVLSEAAYQVRSTEWVLGLVQGGFLKIGFELTKNFDQVCELAGRYADRKPHVADLCLVRMSELYPNYPVMTVDETDFRVYRRNKREAIPLICPPRE